MWRGVGNTYKILKLGRRSVIIILPKICQSWGYWDWEGERGGLKDIFFSHFKKLSICMFLNKYVVFGPWLS